MKPTRGRVFRFVAIFVLFTSSILAQEREPYGPKADSWALQFAIGSNFTLTNFNNGMISLKRHLTKRSAIRLSLNLSTDSYSNEQEQRGGVADTLAGLSNSDYSKIGYGMDIEYYYYLVSEDDLHIYLGGGPRVSYSYLESESSSGLTYMNERRDSEETLNAGAVMHFGAEWFFTKHLSLLAEYGCTATYFTTDRSSSYTVNSDVPNTSTNDTSTDGFRFQDLNVRFGLSVYF